MWFGFIASSTISLIFIGLLFLGGTKLFFKLLGKPYQWWISYQLHRAELRETRARAKLLEEQARNESVRVFLSEKK